MTKAGARTREFPTEEGLPPAWQGKPAGMEPIEAMMWAQFAKRFATTITQWWFNVRLWGNPDPQIPIPDTPDPLMAKIVRGWRDVTAMRCDAIALQGLRYRVVEFRATTATQSIGEVLTYESLARKQYPLLHWDQPLLVTLSITKHLFHSAEARHIEVYMMDLDDTDTLPP